jgi:hypothetical protein
LTLPQSTTAVPGSAFAPSEEWDAKSMICIRLPAEGAAKKEQDRHLQDLSDMLQAGGLDMALPGFIFPELLARHAKRGSERFFRKAEHLSL